MFSRVIITGAILLALPFLAEAQSAGDSVRAAVNKMFSAMRTSNVSLFKTCFTDSAVLQTVAVDRKSGQVSVRNENLKAFAEQVGSLPKDSADERIRFEMVKIDGDLASVWTPYEFYYNKKFSHCGANSFQLVRVNGSWKIHYIIDTRRKDRCN